MVNLTMKLYKLFLFSLLYFPQRVCSYYYPTIFWTPNNCRFNLYKKGGEFFFKVKPGSHLFFVCPNTAIWQDMSDRTFHRGRMFENLMLVDEEGYKTCTVNKKTNPRLNREIFRCDKDPTLFTYTEEILASHRAFPDKMRYTFGKTYHFISTSDGTKSSLDNLSGGHCKTDNMKLKIYICTKDEPCNFEMPPCPYTEIFDGQFEKSTTMKPTTIQFNNTTTLNTSSLPIKINNTQLPSQQLRSKTTMMTEVSTTVVETNTVLENGNTEARGQQKTTIFGDDRKHIIIHITMSLIILILLLCLIYIYIARRNPISHDGKNKGINSELFRARPISLQPIENEPLGHV